MNQWWRSWHGAPTDPKWLAIAQRTQTNAGTVSAIVWALFDHASQAELRGDVSGFDLESYAAFSGFEETTITAIIDALKAKALIKNNTLTAWEKRQPQREDSSAERSKAWRERKRTQTNANEHREDKIREDKIREDKNKKDATPDGVQSKVLLDFEPAEEDDRAKLFRIGKTILVSFGVKEARTGALLGQWLKAQPDPVGLLAAIQYAREHSVAEPISYVSAIVHSKGKPNGSPQVTNLADRAKELANEARTLERQAGIARPNASFGGS